MNHVGRNLALGLLCAAQFVDVLDVNVVVVALPSIGEDLGFSPEDLQWVVSAYVLFFAGFLLLAGRAADLFGRRRMFVAGLALFASASLVCGLAGSAAVLLAARAVQGLAAAITAPAALSLITTIFAEGTERNRAVGAWTAVAAAGGAAGLVLGGLVTDTLGWRWAFFVNVPVGVLGVALSPLLLPAGAPDRDGGTGARRLDLPGAATVTAGLVLLVYGLTRAEEAGFGSPATVTTLALAAALVAAFVLVEGKTADPLVRLGIFRSRDLVGACLVAFALTAVTSSVGVLATIYLQRVLGLSATVAGLAGLPLSLAVIAGSLAGSRLAGRFGARATMALGLLAVAAATLVVSGISAEEGLGRVLINAGLSGLGLGCASVASTAAGTSAAGGDEQGLASGLLNTSAQVGTALGLAVLVAVATARADALPGGVPPPEAQVAGFRWAFFVGAGIAVADGRLRLRRLGLHRDTPPLRLARGLRRPRRGGAPARHEGDFGLCPQPLLG